MKKLFAMMLVVALVMTMAACGAKGSASAEGYSLSDGTPLNLSEKDQKWSGVS